jgi:hypothetical protein
MPPPGASAPDAGFQAVAGGSGKMRLHMQHVADVAGTDPPQHFNKRRRVAAVETDAHGDARLAADIDRLLGAGAGQRQRLFDINMFASLGGGDDLLVMFRMRGGEHHGIDRWIFQHFVKRGNDGDAVFFRIFAVARRIAGDALDDADFGAVLH